MTARLALLVAPSDPLVSSAAARLEALAWLRNQLARRGFQVVIIGSGAGPLADLERAAAGVEPGDSVFVHVSGRLVTTDSVALTRTATLALPALTELLAARSPGYVSVVLDLSPPEDSDEPDAPDLPVATARSLGAEPHGYSVLAAVHPVESGAVRIPFTRRVMPPLDDGGPPSTEALLSAMYDRAATADTGTAQKRAPGFVLLRGAPDPTVDGLVARATEAREWPRVVELRLDRVEGLASVTQRAEELVAIGRILQVELQDADGAVDVIEHARGLDPTRASVLEALRYAYEASGRAPPIDPAEYAKAFAAHRRAGQMDAALLDAMLLEEVGAAEPEHLAVVERSRSVGPVQVLKPLDAPAWAALRAPGFDGALAALLAAVHDAAVAVRVEEKRTSRRPPLDPATRLDPESTVSAVRTLHWAARVLGVECPDLYAAAEDSGELVTRIRGPRPSLSLAPSLLSGTSTKQLAFRAGRALTWYRPEYHSMLHYPTLEDLRDLAGATLAIAGVESALSSSPSSAELARALGRRVGAERAAIDDAARSLGARGAELRLDHWIRSAELTAARVGLLLGGELKVAVGGVRSQPSAPGRPSSERVASDLVAFCASRAHAALRTQFLKLQ